MKKWGGGKLKNTAVLRQKAEELLKNRLKDNKQDADSSGRATCEPTEVNLLKLIQELNVREIELKMMLESVNEQFSLERIEKAQRAAELVIANKELLFQNEEKGKRAEELVIAYKELAYQNEEKAKRAAELLIITSEKVEAGKYDLNERVKELNGLFSLGLLTEKFEKPDDIYNEFVNIVVPDSMQFPEKVFVELELENRKYRNIENFDLQSINQVLFTPVLLSGKLSGSLTVAYIDNLPFIDFHEQNLINAYGERISKITERFNSLRELEKEREKALDFGNKFRLIAENIDEIFWLWTKTEIIYISPSFEKIWGIPCQEIYDNPQKYTEKIHPADRPVLQEMIKSREFKEKGVINYEGRIIGADNQVRWISAKTVPIFNESGEIIKRVGIARDITEKHQIVEDLIKAKEHAEESDRLKSAFLANVSHEIRTPMNGILGFAGLLKDQKLTGEEQQEYIGIIEKSGARMLNIITDIMNISKVEAGQMDVHISETNVNEQIEFIYKFFRPEAKAKGLQFFFNKVLISDEAVIRTDKEKVYAILTNLVNNALKFTREGLIEFGCQRKGKFIEFFVKDTGIGVCPEQKEIIFERFRQGSETFQRKHEGTGLGLAISKAYVEMLGGKIGVESVLGKGSVFYFKIPCDTEAETEAVAEYVVPEVEEGGSAENLKIMIVEDDEVSKKMIRVMVKTLCKEILTVRTGVEAVETCRSHPDIDLILMDIQLPEMDGYEATREIRKFNKEVVIIAQTAFGLVGERLLALAAGCDDYIPKPINRLLLTALINKYCKKNQQSLILN